MRLLAAGLALLLAGPAAAYVRDEHYYTTRLSLDRREGGELAALCSQLADEAPELGAVDTYRRVMRSPSAYAAWSVSGRGPAGVVGVMVSPQQLLHALTGGAPEAVRAVAAGLARELSDRARAEKDPAKRADDLCAVGFALHLYGDTFSHARIHNPARLYGTGIGHFFDATRPDLPLLSPARFALWEDYLTSAPGLIPAASTGEDLAPMFDAAARTLKKARPRNGWALAELWSLEHAAVEKRGLSCAPLPRNRTNRPCREVLAGATRGLTAAPTCEGAWETYREAAVHAFAAWDADPAHAAAPSRAPVRPLTAVSPFPSGGAR
ncbi:MAG: hypothetical protein HY079_13140 [Elusimicrobia bacterium]|nr:hypothetical protein [Elusimicrobiota bacterium]